MTLQEMQKLKGDVAKMQALVNEISARVDRGIAEAMAEETHSAPEPFSFESIVSINLPLNDFKGKKPTGLFLPGRPRVNLGTWKQVAVELLKDCINDPDRKAKLYALRGTASGRNRVFVDAVPDTMRSPAEISRNLFVECHYDTATLLHVVLHILLKSVGYDYSQVNVALKNS